MLITLSSVSKYYGANLILKDINGIVEDNSRIGIIGANGAGKTTLMNILANELDYDSGSIYINPNVKIGYLKQNSLVESQNTIYEEMLSVFSEERKAIEKLSKLDLNDTASKYEYDRLLSFINSRDAYNLETKINTVLNGMGFLENQKNQIVSNLSGGEKTRLALAKLLLTDSNVLLLDEPTNHLDFETCSWLENYLSAFKGAVISVTHDRYYLDRVCDTIWEVEFGVINEYKGNYSFYKSEKKAKLEFERKQYESFIEKQEKLKDYIAKNLVRASTSAMAKSRRKELEKMDDVPPPTEYNKQINLKFNFDKKSWFDVLRVNDLSLHIGSKHLFSNLNLDIKYGSKVAIVGENGTGKTTFFKVLLDAYRNNNVSNIRWGKEVSVGIFEQNHIFEDNSKDVLNEFWDIFPTLTENEVRSKLASLLFCGDDIYKSVGTISGGESARLQLAVLSNQRNNTLLLDEPTNHLDMMSKEKLEDALIDFAGTQFVISHDRYFLNTVPDIIVYLSQDKVIVFNGKFDEFKKKFVTQKIQEHSNNIAPKKTDGYITKAERAKAAQKRNNISKLEKKISQLEQEISELELIISNNSSDFAILEKSCIELENKKREIDTLTEEWLILCEE